LHEFVRSHQSDYACVNAHTCRLCGQCLDGSKLDVGLLPVCNRFTESRTEVPTHKMEIACCDGCGLTQLLVPPPVEAVMPRVPWIRYNEPEAHLDDFVDRLLGGRTSLPSSALGVGLSGGYPYLESWQSLLQPEILDEVARDIGQADIISCRYLLEHCHDPRAGLRSLARLLSTDGLLVIEVPDSSKFVAARDYCFLWEEHVSYFVEEILVAMAEAADFDVVEILRYPGQLEDALISVLRRRSKESARPAHRAAGELVARFSEYREAFPKIRADIGERVAALAGAADHGVALFGAGHQTIMFVNALRLGAHISTLVDDDPNKRGRFAPGFSAPIISSAELLATSRLRACLLAVSPAAEPYVRGKLSALAQRGVAFHTIYAGLPCSIGESRQWH
jgi:SAM-dependent methyltransferase